MKETNLKLSPKDWFVSWFNSPAYHVLYGNRDQTEADHLIQALDNTEVQKGDVILDAGCGAGRHILSWGKRGYYAEGFDLSPESINTAQNNAIDLCVDGFTTFKVLDLRHLKDESNWKGRFDVVTNLFTSFGYFTTSKEHSDVLKGFVNCLRTGGKLVFDYINTPYSKSRLVEDEVINRDGYLFTIHRELNSGFFTKSIAYSDPKGATHYVVEQVKAWTVEELERLLSDVGLQVIKKYGDYDLSVYSNDSPRLILIAEKTS
tara:strand:- start:981 stop:1763 length:783 start_codon:yes stop_codon:yes gene_type:complete